MRPYTVRAIRSGDWWALDVPDLPGVFSQARTLEGAPAAAREAIAVALEVDPDSVSVDVRHD